MFQRLIVDRKFLATFYTLPNSAALLAELAVPDLDVDWGDASAVQKLRMGDLACGTGTLLLAAYQGVLARHRHAGGDDAKLHARMMERGLVAADIMPAATHLTASNLSGTHPGITFERTCVYTMPYGRQPQEQETPIAIGSLDLLDEGHASMALFGTGQRQARASPLRHLRQRHPGRASPRQRVAACGVRSQLHLTHLDILLRLQLEEGQSPDGLTDRTADTVGLR